MHIVYKITNLRTGRFYIGKHSTPDIEDGYMGSSQELLEDIQRSGMESFRKDILFIFDTPEDALKKEAELLPPEVLNDPRCYNKTPGGRGGWGVSVPNFSREAEQKRFQKSIFASELVPPKSRKGSGWAW